jgi:hypothetical protein
MKYYIILVFVVAFFCNSCHKSPGAVCNDGSTSHSTGRGTCSWHGGVDHYIDTSEISISKTTGLVILLIIGGSTLIQNKKKN